MKNCCFTCNGLNRAENLEGDIVWMCQYGDIELGTVENTDPNILLIDYGCPMYECIFDFCKDEIPRNRTQVKKGNSVAFCQMETPDDVTITVNGKDPKCNQLIVLRKSEAIVLIGQLMKVACENELKYLYTINNI